MVLAAWGKKRQFEEGVKQGRAIGRAKALQCQVTGLGKKYDIPEDELPIEDEDEDE